MIEVARPAPTVEHLSPTSDRDRLDRALSASLAEASRRHLGNAHLIPLYEHLKTFVLRGGKRLRPRLCLASYRILSDRDAEPPRSVWMASASLEIFHAFMLAHDDLIDGSHLRRDQATLHESIRLDHANPDSKRARKLGADLGLIGGDLLFALGMRMVSRAQLDPKVAPRVQRLLADMLFETGLGEALDVLYDHCPLNRISEDQILEAYLRKTARYSISAPLMLGATLADAPRAVVRALARFGDLLGLGYQIRNDLDALAVDPLSGDHPDLDGGKRTLVLWTAHRKLPPMGQHALQRTLNEPAGPERRQKLLDLIHASQAIEACEARLRELEGRAHAELLDAPLDPTRRRALLSLLDLLPGGAACPTYT
ncbi:polyprenyl synthetase family protein [soil metagenome]